MKRRVVSVLLVFCTLFVLLGTMGQKKEWHMTQNEVVHECSDLNKRNSSLLCKQQLGTGVYSLLCGWGRLDDCTWCKNE